MIRFYHTKLFRAIKIKEKEEKMLKEKVKLNSEKINIRERRIKALKLGLLISLLFLIIIYVILRIVYTQGAFTIALDQNFAKKSGLIMYENGEIKEGRRVLEADKKEFMDNISINWLPKDLNEHPGGAHNGDNYIAYTFFVENQGSQTTNYWYTIIIDDIIRDVDEAVRVMIYHNGAEEVYAKIGKNGKAEANTTPFYSDKYVLMRVREDFNEGDRDKFTIVIWIEGDDPDCIDYLIGGQMKMHMEITEEHIEQ